MIARMKTAALLAGLALLVPAPAVADTPTLDERVAALEQEVDDIESQMLDVQASADFAQVILLCMGRPQGVDNAWRPVADRDAQRYVFIIRKRCITPPKQPAVPSGVDPTWEPFTGPAR